MAKVIDSSDESLKIAGNEIKGGKLVAFPTETVYGLGANVFHERALAQIFKVKNRPMNDPLIAHVINSTSAMDLLDFGHSPEVEKLFLLLTGEFWPGPLTVVSRASSSVSDLVTASTGFIGVRSPSHYIARKLLIEAGVPICAPSANRFGHVSPTSAAHVMTDLGSSDITIIEPENEKTCEIGIESTVVKLDSASRTVVILRKGAITAQKIEKALGSEFAQWKVIVKKNEEDIERLSPQIAPGQLLKHYSPDIEAFLVSFDQNGAKDFPTELTTCLVLDFAGQCSELKERCRFYRDLSVKGNEEEAAHSIFESLRWAESQIGIEKILIASIPNAKDGSMAAAYNDRIYRAASGKKISFPG